MSAAAPGTVRAVRQQGRGGVGVTTAPSPGNVFSDDTRPTPGDEGWTIRLINGDSGQTDNGSVFVACLADERRSPGARGPHLLDRAGGVGGLYGDPQLASASATAS